MSLAKWVPAHFSPASRSFIFVKMKDIAATSTTVRTVRRHGATAKNHQSMTGGFWLYGGAPARNRSPLRLLCSPPAPNQHAAAIPPHRRPAAASLWLGPRRWGSIPTGSQMATARMLSHSGRPFVLPPGIEPGSQVPQTCILSIKLRERVRNQKKVYFLLCFERSSRNNNYYFLRQQEVIIVVTGSTCSKLPLYLSTSPHGKALRIIP